MSIAYRLRALAASAGSEPVAQDAARLDWIERYIRKHNRSPEFHPDWPDLRTAIDDAMGERRSSMDNWIKASERQPADGVVVDTKIDDSNGVRNEGPLKRQGDLWFTEDGAMYVYYRPTHWRPTDPVERTRRLQIDRNLRRRSADEQEHRAEHR